MASSSSCGIVPPHDGRNLPTASAALLLAASVFMLQLLHTTEGSSVTIKIRNNCRYTIWPGILSNAGAEDVAETGLELKPGEGRSFPAPAAWSGRIWARTGCDWSGGGGGGGGGSGVCETGDCGVDGARGAPQCAPGRGATPPATLVEITLAGGGGGLLDYYDVSVVDGYNVGVEVAAEAAAGGGGCDAVRCAADEVLLGRCPAALADLRGGGAGSSSSSIQQVVVACKSACVAFGSPQFCCSAAYATPATCGPSSYSRFFKAACPRAYTYAFDDKTATFTCAAASTYSLTFCPTTTNNTTTPTTSTSTPSTTTSTTSSGYGANASSTPPYGDDYGPIGGLSSSPTWWNSNSWNDNASNRNNGPILSIFATFFTSIFVLFHNIM